MARKPRKQSIYVCENKCTYSLSRNTYLINWLFTTLPAPTWSANCSIFSILLYISAFLIILQNFFVFMYFSDFFCIFHCFSCLLWLGEHVVVLAARVVARERVVPAIQFFNTSIFIIISSYHLLVSLYAVKSTSPDFDRKSMRFGFRASECYSKSSLEFIIDSCVWELYPIGLSIQLHGYPPISTKR